MLHIRSSQLLAVQLNLPYLLCTVLAQLLLLTSCSPVVSEGRNFDSFQLQSSAFQNGGRLPDRYTALLSSKDSGATPGATTKAQFQGAPLTWSKVPTGTASFVLIIERVDKLTLEKANWQVYNLDGKLRSIPEDAGRNPAKSLPGAFTTTYQDFKSTAGQQFQFTLFAMSNSTAPFSILNVLKENEGARDFAAKFQNAILGTAKLFCTR